MSGYTKSSWEIVSRPKPPTVPRDPSETRKKGHITLPYVGHVTDALARTIRKAGVAVHLRPYNSIRSQLVHPKDRVRKSEVCGSVYKVECADCPASYVGETERELKFRVAEHHRLKSSHVCQHLVQAKHTFNDEGVSVLHREPDYFKRGVAEAIHIDRETPSLNRDRGRHTLPSIYREIITPQSHDQTTPRVM